MDASDRSLRYAKYLLWTLMVLNMLGLYLLQHPSDVNAAARPATSFAAR